MNKVWIIILGTLNILAFCLLAVVYYAGYDLHTGGTRGAFTWGLSIPIAAILALISGILAIKRKSWRWGVIGLAVAVVIFLSLWAYLWILSQGF
jgi:phosphatidylserine synthase